MYECGNRINITNKCTNENSSVLTWKIHYQFIFGAAVFGWEVSFLWVLFTDCCFIVLADIRSEPQRILCCTKCILTLNYIYVGWLIRRVLIALAMSLASKMHCSKRNDKRNFCMLKQSAVHVWQRKRSLLSIFFFIVIFHCFSFAFVLCSFTCPLSANAITQKFLLVFLSLLCSIAFCRTFLVCIQMILFRFANAIVIKTIVFSH